MGILKKYLGSQKWTGSEKIKEEQNKSKTKKEDGLYLYSINIAPGLKSGPSILMKSDTNHCNASKFLR